MAGIIGSSECKDVRAALDVSLDETALPDAVISLPLYMQAAEREVLARDPLASTYGDLPNPYGTDWRLRHARNAAIFLTAARLATALPQILSKDWPNFKLTYAKRDWEARASDLRGLAAAELAAYLEEDGLPAPPTMFALASGTRGR